MTADEIRKTQVVEGESGISSACALWEIAAQLAELNENIKKAMGQSHFERIFGK